MIPGMGVHIGSAVIGVFLVTVSLLFFMAGYWPWLRKRLEDIFIPGKHLFEAKQSYSGTVTFFRWSAFLFGILLVLPTFVILDILIAAIAFFFWRHFVWRAHAAMVGR